MAFMRHDITIDSPRARRARSMVWTMIYQTGIGCRYVQFGHEKGPIIGFKLIKKLGQKFKKDNERIDVICPADYYHRFDKHPGIWNPNYV